MGLDRTAEVIGRLALALIWLPLAAAGIGPTRISGGWPGPITRGIATLAMAIVVAWVVEPGWVDWAVVGLPDWARLGGIPIGLIGLRLVIRRHPWTGPVFGLAGFLLSGCWPAALASARLAALGSGAEASRSPAPVPGMSQAKRTS